MTTITVAISDERLARLRALAERPGLSPEEFQRREIDQMLQRPDEACQEASAYVLKKNAELYRRLGVPS